MPELRGFSVRRRSARRSQEYEFNVAREPGACIAGGGGGFEIRRAPFGNARDAATAR